MGLFLLSRECGPRKPALAFTSLARYTPADAQVPRHTPDFRRDAHPDRRDALADQQPPTPEGSDKLVHFIAFAALAFPLARTGRIGLLPVFVGASAFGGAIELIQPSFNRSADINDWIADIVGVALGIGCGLMYRRIRRR